MITTTTNINEFRVQSHTNKEIWYEVNIVTHKCSCPHYINRLKYTGGSCKHYRELLQYLSDDNSLFEKIEKEIKLRGNNVAWEDILPLFEEGVVMRMLQLNRLWEPKPGRLGVLE